MKNNSSIFLNKKIIIFIIIDIIFLFLILFSDYKDFYSNIGIDVSNFNLDALNITLNIFFMLLLYLITFIVIDSENIKRKNNQKNILKIALISTYKTCLDYIKLFDDPDAIEKFKDKIDPNKPEYENKVVLNMKSIPFEEEKLLNEFATNGVFEEELFKNYLDIKHKYKSYISLVSVLYDRVDLIKKGRDELVNLINIQIKKIS